MATRKSLKGWAAPQWLGLLGVAAILVAALWLTTGLTSASRSLPPDTGQGWLDAAPYRGFAVASSPAVPHAPQATVIVTSTADSGAGSLRQAIQDAAAGDTINFDASLSGQTIALASPLTITKNLTIDGSGLANQVTLSGGSAVRVFYLAAGNTVNLNNLTIADGAFAGNGGGIYNDGATLTVLACNLNNHNASAGNGGAIYNNTNGLLTVSASNFDGNLATGQGGAIYSYQGTVNIAASSFVHNTSASHGSVLFSFYGSALTVTIANSSFYSNTSTAGKGAVYVRTNLVVKNSTFSGNRAPAVVDIADFANCTSGPACTIQLGNNIFADAGAGKFHVGSDGGTPPATWQDLGYNVIDTNENVAFNNASSKVNTNPLLGPWADNGGATPPSRCCPVPPLLTQATTRCAPPHRSTAATNAA